MFILIVLGQDFNSDIKMESGSVKMIYRANSKKVIDRQILLRLAVEHVPVKVLDRQIDTVDQPQYKLNRYIDSIQISCRTCSCKGTRQIDNVDLPWYKLNRQKDKQIDTVDQLQYKLNRQIDSVQNGCRTCYTKVLDTQILQISRSTS